MIIDGEPVPKQRVRVTRSGTYTPPRTKQAEQVVAWKFRQAHPRHVPDARAGYGLYAEFYCRNRKSDMDNFIKLIMDALIGVAWADDRQVDEVCMRRHIDRVSPRTEFCVYLLEPGL